ncbi:MULTISPECIES: hypothetical protein [unclassified Bradyrhizobium]|uniref:hypothetical protein n=1 Tax=unclassified Bradyrhizobium TaxID=2631580 RepID=UPI0028E78729|nr:MULTISPECIES: hypothetical protein [unclassified Bradyrhizobium]
MGQAKARTASLTQWRALLDPSEQIVFDVAFRTYERFVKPRAATGMCYRMAFFLTAYLAERHGLRVDPVVGFVNDGTDDLMISHAWIELGGKKTDISLTITGQANIPGPLLILDREVTRGLATYTYHRERGAVAEMIEQEFLANPRGREVVIHKRSEHAQMMAIAADTSSIVPYLNAAPDGLGYRQIAAVIG